MYTFMKELITTLINYVKLTANKCHNWSTVDRCETIQCISRVFINQGSLFQSYKLSLYIYMLLKQHMDILLMLEDCLCSIIFS